MAPAETPTQTSTTIIAQYKDAPPMQQIRELTPNTEWACEDAAGKNPTAPALP